MLDLFTSRKPAPVPVPVPVPVLGVGYSDLVGPSPQEILNVLRSMEMAQDAINRRLIRMESRLVALMAASGLDRNGKAEGQP